MSNVTLTIGGRTYTVACAEGEEGHVLGLGRMIEEKLASMGDAAGQTESRSLLFASLLLADDLHETRGRTSANPAPAAAPNAHQFAAIASRLENLATRLESAGPSA